MSGPALHGGNILPRNTVPFFDNHIMNLMNFFPSYVRYASGDSDGLRDYKYITADSRSVFDAPETLFVAIKTALADGRKYIPELYEKGVKAFMVEEIPPECAALDATFFVVDSIPEALRGIACARVQGQKHGLLITGSVGKTKLKELLFTALQYKHNVRRSPGSWNSSIGLPLALWDMTDCKEQPEYIISEVGIDGPGQAEKYAATLAGSHEVAFITPVTGEHDEAFASHAEKIKEKIRLASICKTIYYADTDPEVGRYLQELTEDRKKQSLPCPDVVPVQNTGVYPSIYHAMAAAYLKDKVDVNLLSSISLVETKREISSEAFGNILVRDRFTPDLRSLREALDFIRRQATSAYPVTLVLGDLLHKDDMTTEELVELYNSAFDLAQGFGVKNIICISDELAEISKLPGADVHPGIEICGRVASYAVSRYNAGKLIANSHVLLFGIRQGSFLELSDAMESASHDTVLEVDLDALAHNYNFYRSLLPAGTGVVAMVKASAYGMGAIEIGKTLQSIGAASLAVAVIEEGIALRDAGITMPVIVLNPVTNRYPALFAARLEPAVFSLDELDKLVEEAENYGTFQYPVHIKLDTGMHRVGFLQNQLKEVAARLSRTNAVKVASVFSHLATADCLDMDDYTLGQIKLFSAMTKELSEELGYTFKRHILNTAGMMRFSRACEYEMGRLGIGLYGISPYDSPLAASLRPVASLYSRIVSLKHWPAGTPVGYGCRGITDKDSVIATVPIGYADGLARNLSRGAYSFGIKGVKCPIIGNICMDQCMVDVTAVPDVAIGDRVEIFGPGMPVENIAEVLGTIPYEILTSVAPRVKRIYLKR